MGHINRRDGDLHNEHGEHLSTPATADGRVLASHERRLSEHLSEHRRLAELWSRGQHSMPKSPESEDADQRFWTLAVTEPPSIASLVGIVDEEAGGFIAYACGAEHADHILRLLRAEQEQTNETAVAISYDPRTDQIAVVGRPIPWGDGHRALEQEREPVTGWGGYTHRVTLVDDLSTADLSRYWLVGPRPER